jgi:hypothetical protein
MSETRWAGLLQPAIKMVAEVGVAPTIAPFGADVMSVDSVLTACPRNPKSVYKYSRFAENVKNFSCYDTMYFRYSASEKWRISRKALELIWRNAGSQ